MSADAENQDFDVPTDNIEFLIRRIRTIRDEEGEMPSEMMRMLASIAGVSERTAYRWVARGSKQRPATSQTQLTPELRTLYFEMGGSVSRVLRHCVRAGVSVPSRATLQRVYRRELSAAERSFAKAGEAGRRANTVYLAKEYPHRNAVWETDHTQLGVYVIPPRVNAKPTRPWLTTFLEGKHRVIAGAAISLQPTTGDVLAAFKSGVLNDPESISPVYGAPDELHWDNGREFLSNAMTEVALTMGVFPRALPAYSPHLKGKIERWHRTLQDEFLGTLPFNDKGPRKADGTLYGSEQARLSYTLFCQLLLKWIRHYNFERPHSSLSGLTPAESWLTDPAMVREFSADELRWMSLPSKTCKVGPSGIHHAGHKYVAPEVIALRNERVEIRYMPHDDRSVDVYRDGSFICTAYIADALSAEEQQRFLAERQRQHRAAVRERRTASRRARVRFASVTGSADSPEEQVTVIDRQQAEAAGGLHRAPEEAPSVPASPPDGLNQPWTPPSHRDAEEGQA